MSREDVLRALAKRLGEREANAAFLVALYARSARGLGLGLDGQSMHDALDAFDLAHQHASFAQDQVALEVYGVFWARVTSAMMFARNASAEAAS